MESPWHERIRDAYKESIGRHRRQLATPALILDLEVAKRNIRFMMERLASMHARLRPHVKVQKCAELALLQVQAGAIGVCTATVWEALVMRKAGIADVLIANQVGGAEKLRALARASRDGGLTLAVDDERNAEQLSREVTGAGGSLEVLVELDVGMGRGGARSVDGAISLARAIDRLPGLRLRGMMGYEGHCMLEPDPALRKSKAREAMDRLYEAVDALKRNGFEVATISAGGTGTYDITGNDPRVTEIQAGSYVFMDNFHGSLVPGFRNSLTVLGTVVIQHGSTIVLDCGRKSIGIDFVSPTLLEYPFYAARYFAEEHALFDVDGRCALRLGDTAELVPGYAPTTVNLHDVYYVVEGDRVVDVWPIVPRGPGHAGLLA